VAPSTEGLDRSHLRPAGASDDEVRAAGKVSEALEWIERARGHLYSFHQLVGHADFLLDDAVSLLDATGNPQLAEQIRRDVIGRNVLDGRWTFQLIEKFDDGYYATARQADGAVREHLVAGRRHVYEAELKEHRRSHGHPGHESRPPEPERSR